MNAMRVILVLLAFAGGFAALSGCSSTGNTAAALNEMNNPANSCGPGGSADIEDCDNRR